MKEELIKNLEEPLKEIGVKIYEISFEKEDNIDTLFIKLEGNVDTDLCAKAAEIINPIVDKLDLIEGEYVLDICSKGEDDGQ